MATGFGIIGCGMIATFHARALAEIRGAKLIGCFDAVSAASERTAAGSGPSGSDGASAACGLAAAAGRPPPVVERRPGRVGVVWRQFMTKADGEFVNHAVFVEKDGRVLIDHCLIC